MRKFLLLFLFLSLFVQCASTKIGTIPVGQNPDSYTRYFPDDNEEIDVLAVEKVAKQMCTQRGFKDLLGYEIDNISKSKWAELPMTGSPKYRNLYVWCSKN